MTTSDTPAAADPALSTTPAVTPAAAGIALSVDAPAGPTVVSTNAAVVPPPVTSITPSELASPAALLRTAYNSGADTVTYEGKTVHYRDASRCERRSPRSIEMNASTA